MSSTTDTSTVTPSPVVVGLPASPRLRESSVVLHGVTWSQYQSLLDTFGDRRLPHTYDQGTLELKLPSQ